LTVDLTLRGVLRRAPTRDECCHWAELASFIQLRGTVQRLQSGSAARGPLEVTLDLPNPDAFARACRVADLRALDGTRYRHGSVGLTFRPADVVLRRAGLLNPTGRLVRGLPTQLVHGTVCDAAAAWRAALLVAGSVRQPASRRRALAVACPNPVVALALVALARRLGATAHTNEDKDQHCILVTGPANLGAVLTATGGSEAMTAWADTYPDIPPTRARRRSFENANTDRARHTATAVASDIAAAFAEHDPDSFAPHLRAAAALRLAYPDLSLTELGECADPPLSKDTMYGRLRRFLAQARALSINNADDAERELRSG
jgi:DNA-binding protein WhiA